MKYAVTVILFLCLWAYPAWAQGEDWIPEGAILENETEENGMRILSYLMPETGEMLALTLNNETNAPMTLMSTPRALDNTTGLEAVSAEEALVAGYPDAWVISSGTVDIQGKSVARFCVLAEQFYGAIWIDQGQIIGRELTFAPCLRDGMITLQGAVSALRLLRPEAVIYEIELDGDDGLIVYEGEAQLAGESYEFELDAHSGQLLEWAR